VIGLKSGANVLEESFDKPDEFDVKHDFHSSSGIYKGPSKQEEDSSLMV
jgi:hypothetical protein